MRILICSLEAPLLPLNGLRLQVRELAAALTAEHEVRILAYRMLDQTAPGASGAEIRLIDRGPGRAGLGKAAGLARSLSRGRPPGAAELARGMAPALEEELDRFVPDVVHVTSGRLAELWRWLGDRPKVLAALDAWHLNVEAEAAVSSGARRMARRVEARAVRRFEQREYPRFDRVVVVSEEDGQALHEVGPSIPVEVIPNGVDAAAFASDGAARDPGRLLFTGVMDYAPNISAAELLARRVLPLVRREAPGATLALVGRRPAPQVQALAGRPGIEVIGEVPDLRPWLSRAGVYVCPMVSGTGVKNKLLEAMANGLPCVATTLALRGLQVQPGREVLVAEDDQGLAQAAVRLIGDRELASRLGLAAVAYVRATHGWAAVAKVYARVYAEALSAHSRRG